MLTVFDIAAAMGGTAHGDADITVTGVAEPAEATADDIALAMSPKFAAALEQGAALVAVLWPEAPWKKLGLKAAITLSRPRLGLAHLTQLLDTPRAIEGIHPTAVIDPSARLGAEVAIGPFCVIGADTVVGDRTVLLDHVTVGPDTEIGSDGFIGSGVRLGRRVQIGHHAILHPNCVIGADGFSFVTETPSIAEIGRKTLGKTPFEAGTDAIQHRIHSLGGVALGDDVEVGANSTIDAGTIRATRVGRGTKIDNLVQVGHNVVVGEDCLLCAQTAIAGSAVIGDRCILGGKSGVADNITIGPDCLFGGAAIALGDIAPGSFVMGYPAKPMLTYRAEQRALRDAAKSK